MPPQITRVPSVSTFLDIFYALRFAKETNGCLNMDLEEALETHFAGISDTVSELQCLS